MKQVLILEGDTNDGDYVDSIIDISPDSEYHAELLRVVRKVADVLKHHKINHEYGRNWAIGEYCNATEHPTIMYDGILSKEEIELFSDEIPWGESGVHTITTIRVLTVTEDEILF